MTSSPIHDYIEALDKELAAGNTTEHTHRPALKALFQSLNHAITATNEPQHITAIGAPDFRIIKNKLAIGYVECKDIGKNLDEALETDQLKRYLHSFHNLLLTDYLEFRWYVGGKLRLQKTLGTILKNKIKQDKDSLSEVADCLISFLNNEPEPIGSPKELAGHMARLADIMRDSTIRTLNSELATGSLHAQLLAFRENLIPDLSIEQFADMYAQTIAYGLFAARCETDNGKEFTRQQASYLIPKTNPFLRKLFNYIAGPDLDGSITWAVDDLAQILAWADMEAVLKDFGKSTGKTDPVVHFYETFLKEYNPKTREMRGVYYTPLPVVSYIVRSIDYILKTSFDKPQGLADPSVLVLDPAVGTATFLYMVMQEIHEAVIKQGQTGTWDNYVTEKLLPRLFGFELLMAPYAIAHLKLERMLKETGYQFQTDQRLQIYLTNTLGEGIAPPQQYYGLGHDLAVESGEANQIKREKPIVVVLGNPPYSVNSINRSDWITGLIADYKQGLNEKKLNLDDDYIKFIRFAQWRIEETGYGILGFITNNSYLDGLTHRRMREYLLNGFSYIYILNLHGNSRRGEKAPDNIKDENVFDIQQGVAIGIFIKKSDKTEIKHLYYADLWGLREGKYKTLSESEIPSTDWQELTPNKPEFLFVPVMEMSKKKEYENGWSIKSIFPLNNDGIQTKRDNLTVQYTEQELNLAILDVKNMEDTDLRQKYHLSNDGRDWAVERAKYDIANNPGNVEILTYRPFDKRYTYYTGKSKGFLGYPRAIISNHLKNAKTIALATNRFVKLNDVTHFFAIRSLVDTHVLETANSCLNVSPLYLYPTEKNNQIDKSGGKEGGTIEPMKLLEKREPNLSPAFINTISDKLQMRFIDDGKGDLQETFGPDDIFHYIYAVFHSPVYRSRYAEFLKRDFPRLPLTSDKALFRSLVEKGATLVALHLMESPLLNTKITKYEVKGEHAVDKVAYDEKTQRVSINKTQFFEGVPPVVWNFHIGGYQVCEKWLKDRQKAHRKLTIDDIDHYQTIVVALKETIRLMSEIDQTIEEHGGWPGAFE